MCGIVGIYNWDSEDRVDEQTIRAMCLPIVHRGPDDEGVHVDGRMGMGMRRLSIIDLAGGHQPIFSEDGQIAVVLNGEIYNFQELRRKLEAGGHRFRSRTDTEVLVHGYEQWGDDLPRKLNGMFAFCIWDARQRRVVLARDRIGIKPLYVYRDHKRIAWASEIKALLTLPGVRAELDEAALLRFLTFGYVPAPRTLFRGITKMSPASVVTLQDGKEAADTYWNLPFHSQNRSTEDWCEELRSLLDDAVRCRLMSDVPLGAFLSGGVDSSAIVATMHRLGVENISTYAIGFGRDDAFHSELDRARSVARAYHTDHHEIVVDPNVADLMAPLIHYLDEPFADTSFLVTYLVSKLARQTVTVILSGLGGDEVFAGYRRYLGPKIQHAYDWTPRFVDRGMIRPLARRLPVDRGSRWKSLFRHARGFLDGVDLPPPERYQGYVGILSNGSGRTLLAPDLVKLHDAQQPDDVAAHYRQTRGSSSINRMLYADLKTSLVDSLLTFTDKMSMAVSLEARVPLLDHRLIELAARIPPELKLRGLTGMKYIFKRAVSDRLPDHILHGRKMGFGTPISRWFRTSLRPLLEDTLSTSQLTRRGYFNPAAVRQLIDDHMQQRADNSEHLLTLLTFEMWHQTFLDRAVA